MIKKLNKFQLAIGATALLGAALSPSYAFAAETKDSSSVSQEVTDTAISTKLRVKLLADERIKKSDIQVNTTNRVVTLTGAAATEGVKDAAEMIAKAQEGVVKVDNKLVIATAATLGEKTEQTADKVGHSVKHAANATGEVISDSYITSKIKSRLLAAKGVTSAGISVDTVDGVVTLSGHVPHESEMTKAIAIAKSTRGVKSVEATKLEVASSN